MPINPLADYLDQLPTDPHTYTKEAVTKYLKQIKKFKDDGIDFDRPDEDGLTPLLIAIDKHPKLVNALLDYGADPNIAAVKSGMAPLHVAAFNGDKKIVEALVNRGANVNAEDNNKETPLHMAFLSNNSEVVGLLITSGADQNARNNDGNRPYDEFKKKQTQLKQFSTPSQQPVSNRPKQTVRFNPQITDKAIPTPQAPPSSPRSVIEVENLAKPQQSNSTSDLKTKNITNYIDRIINEVTSPGINGEGLPALYKKLETSLGKNLTESFKKNVEAMDQLDLNIDETQAYKKEVTGVYIKKQQELATKSVASPLITSCESPSTPSSTPSKTRTATRVMSQ